jgi:hypothetical protein
VADPENLDDARATLRTIVLGDLVAVMPQESYEFLQQATDIAVQSLFHPYIRWAVKAIGDITDG